MNEATPEQLARFQHELHRDTIRDQQTRIRELLHMLRRVAQELYAHNAVSEVTKQAILKEYLP